jgi:phenylalanyl-tRNA synthetase alpha chain
VSGIQEQLGVIEQEALVEIEAASDAAAIERVRVKYLGKKGSLTRILRGFGELPEDERPNAGKLVNASKARVQALIGERQDGLASLARSQRLQGPPLDVTLPAYGQPAGHVHPLSRATAEICETLCSLGFSIADGPEVEDDYHNFEALNIPAEHPARDMQDTFFTDRGLLLRTHTSPVQIRVMKEQAPPLMIIAPGAVYRIDDDVTHSPMFHQVEGLMVDEGINFGHLKYVLTSFLRETFGADSPVRFRPSYFPFTEPSAEVDIGCVICSGSGSAQNGTCRVCKGTGWLEILGAGMVDPAVFEHVDYDAERFTGFAFGVGVERIAMLKYGVGDIRQFFANDLRFLEQF